MVVALFLGLLCSHESSLGVVLSDRKWSLMKLKVMGRLEMFRSVVLTAVPSFDGDLFVANRAGPVVPFIVMGWACEVKFPGFFGWEVRFGKHACAGLVVCKDLSGKTCFLCMLCGCSLWWGRFAAGGFGAFRKWFPGRVLCWRCVVSCGTALAAEGAYALSL